MMKLILLFSVIILLGCKSQTPIKFSDQTITFAINFPVADNTIKGFSDLGLYVFADFKTKKKIQCFNDAGQLLKTIDIEPLIREKGINVEDFCFLAKDTIALLDKYTNRIFIIDDNAKIIDKKDYSDYLKRGLELTSFFTFSHKKKKLIAGINFTDPNFPSVAHYEDYLRSYEQRMKTPLFFVINSLNDTTQKPQTVSTLYSRFVKSGEMNIESVHYLNLDDGILFYSRYSDTLYLLDKQFNIRKMEKVSSQFYPINNKPTKIKSFLSNMNLVAEDFHRNNLIFDIKYDQYKELYYVIIKGEMTDENPLFSLLILDKNLKKRTEIKIDNTQFRPIGFVTKKGLYLEHIQSDWSKREFKILNYE